MGYPPMTSPPNRPLAATLHTFSRHQLAGMRAGDITNVTTHQILTTAFFTGATIHLAAADKQPKSVYLPVLRQFLARTFDLNEERAAGLLESNARMYKRYTLVDRVYHEGWKTAQDWRQENGATQSVLKTLLREFQDLSMSDLNIEGVKEEQATLPEIEAIVATETTPVSVAPPTRRMASIIYWLLLLGVFAIAGYFALFPEHIPPRLMDAIASVLPPE
ncbi:MAG: hypothetical protein GXP17_08655 [Gammaproteobacteria bacterium]|nr:hypothetical protein [Gammaproteobacteria bacterium]